MIRWDFFLNHLRMVPDGFKDFSCDTLMASGGYQFFFDIGLLGLTEFIFPPNIGMHSG